MKRIFTLLFCLLAAASATSGHTAERQGEACSTTHAADGSIRPAKKSVTQRREVRRFEEIAASSGITVLVRQADEWTAEVSADKNIIDRVQTEVVGNTLRIRYRNNTSINGRHEPTVVRVSCPVLTNISATSGTDITFTNLFEGEALTVHATSAARGHPVRQSHAFGHQRRRHHPDGPQQTLHPHRNERCEHRRIGPRQRRGLGLCNQRSTRQDLCTHPAHGKSDERRHRSILRQSDTDRHFGHQRRQHPETALTCCTETDAFPRKGTAKRTPAAELPPGCNRYRQPLPCKHHGSLRALSVPASLYDKTNSRITKR